MATKELDEITELIQGGLQIPPTCTKAKGLQRPYTEQPNLGLYPRDGLKPPQWFRSLSSHNSTQASILPIYKMGTS